MTLREWNKLPLRKRRRIIDLFYWNMSEDFRNDMSQEFHHNFNWQGTQGTYQEGRWYELMLKHCKLLENSNVKITVFI